jgi:hypothetical protein
MAFGTGHHETTSLQGSMGNALSWPDHMVYILFRQKRKASGGAECLKKASDAMFIICPSFSPNKRLHSTHYYRTI